MPLAAGTRIVGLVGVVALAVGVSSAFGQVNAGEIYGRVTDGTGAVLPGAAVTLSSLSLLQPVAAVTTRTGTYRFPLIPIGLYAVRFELVGFAPVVREAIRVEIGLSARVDAMLPIGGLEEVVRVPGRSPLLDVRDAGTGSRFDREALQRLPTARDPWAMIEQSAGVVMDRQNVGGNLSGQQGNHVARGTARESKWSLDGVDITDMAATGSSPFYYDFDAFEEIQVITAGADVTMQSPGLAVNLVTKSGSDTLRGSARYYLTDEKFESDNVTADLRLQGVYTGNPIQNIQDYGVEAGGPLRKGRAWVWGSYGTQRIAVGVNNFYKSDPACQQMASVASSHALPELRACLEADRTTLNTYNLKLALQASPRSQLSFFFNAAEKTRPTREASDLRSVESTLRQGSVTRDDLGSRWWTTGIPKTYKWTDRHVFSDRFLLEGSYAHVGNNYLVTFHDETLRGVQPALESTTKRLERSNSEDLNLRPAHILSLAGNALLPGLFRGDHALKFGVTWRNDAWYRETTVGGDAAAIFNAGSPWLARLYRGATSEYGLHNRSFYVQDSYSTGRLTVNAGFRFDHQSDYTNPAAVAASPFWGQATFAGARFPFTQLPAASNPGARPAAAFDDLSPRVSASIDLTGTGRTVLKLSFARYTGQLGGSNPIATVGSPAVLTYVTYPWRDVNGDRFVQANEIVLSATPVEWSPGYDYSKPSSPAGSVDPQLTAERTSEVIVGLEKLLGRGIAVGASYIWRRYGNARWNDTTGWTSANYASATLVPTGCPAGARCAPVTYYNPVGDVPLSYVLANQPDFRREYRGIEVTTRKRWSDGWAMNASLSFNDARAHYGSDRAYEDPTNIENLNGAQYAPQYAADLTSTGIGNTFVNARWILRLSGSCRTPFWGVDLAGFYDSRGGYPFVQFVETLRSGAGTAVVYLDRLGDKRLPAVRTLDLRAARRVRVGRFDITPSVDAFNLLNTGTPLSIRGKQNAPNANLVSSILPPRVIRFGLRAEW
jgi:hypothetical protein